jgi:hypothetical protein
MLIIVARVLGAVAVGAIAFAWYAGARTEAILVALLAVGLAYAGLTWIVRIVDDGADEPAAWRYRDR